MALPLLPIAALAAGAYFLFANSEADAMTDDGKSAVKAEPGGKVSNTIPTPDGKGFKLTTTPENLAAIMAMAKANNPDLMLYMAKQFKADGKPQEAKACEYLAQIMLDQKAGKKSPKPNKATTEAKKKTEVALKASDAAVKSPGIADTKIPPTGIIKQVADATAAGDTKKMRELAAKLREAGFDDQATSWERAADAIDAAKVVPPAPLPSIPTVVIPDPEVLPEPAAKPSATAAPKPAATAKPKAKKTTTPPMLPAKKPTARRAAADALVKHLAVDQPGPRKESTALIAAYQEAAGLKGDGKFGPGTAKTLAEPESGGYVPPPPRMWPTATYYQAIKDYEAWLLKNKAEDAARAAEWQAGYVHARDFWPNQDKPERNPASASTKQPSKADTSAETRAASYR